MKQFFLLVTTVLSVSVSAQERFARTITSADLETHLLKIASEEMEGRETATEGQRKAAAYIEDQFKKLNLKPVLNEGYQQAFPVYRDSLANVKFSINNVELKYDTDYAVANNSGFNFFTAIS